MRPTDIMHTAGDLGKAKRMLGWQAEMLMKGMVQRLAKNELRQRRAVRAQ